MTEIDKLIKLFNCIKHQRFQICLINLIQATLNGNSYSNSIHKFVAQMDPLFKLIEKKISLNLLQWCFILLLAQAACVRHACLRAPCVAWPLLLPSFSLSSFLFFFFFSPSFAFDPLQGISRAWKFVSPNILA